MQALVLPGWSFGVAVPWPGHVSPGPGGGWEFAFLAWSKLLERDNVHNGMLEGELKRKKGTKAGKNCRKPGKLSVPSWPRRSVVGNEVESLFTSRGIVFFFVGG